MFPSQTRFCLPRSCSTSQLQVLASAAVLLLKRTDYAMRSDVEVLTKVECEDKNTLLHEIPTGYFVTK